MFKNNKKKTLYLISLVAFLVLGLIAVLYLVLQRQGFFESRNYAAPADGRVDLNIETGEVKTTDTVFTISLKIYPDGNSVKSGDLSFSYDHLKLRINKVVIRRGDGEVLSSDAFIFSNLGQGRALSTGICAENGIACLAFSSDVIYNSDGSITGVYGGVVADVTFEPVSGSFSDGDVFNINYIGASVNKITDADSTAYADIILNNLTITVQGGTCVQNCVGKQCGDLDSNCNEVCLNCPDGDSCTEASGTYSCVSTCADTCENMGYECGTHEICGEQISCGTTCDDGEFCNDLGLCEVEISECSDTCASIGYECGTFTICGISKDCGSCTDGETCNNSGVCGATPTPTCTDTCSGLGYECGSHTVCNENISCGTCSSGQTCNSSGQCVTSCTANCTGKTCGSDGCDGSCGSCSSGQTCNSSGQCVTSCTANCAGKTCGSNGCGGSCGNCTFGQTCNSNGVCVSNGSSAGVDSENQMPSTGIGYADSTSIYIILSGVFFIFSAISFVFLKRD